MFGDEQFYDKIRLVAKDAEPVEKERSRLQYTAALLSGRIVGQFVALQPLHVGTGLLVPPAEVGIGSDVPLLKSFHQIDGRLTIPGSSLKGPVRSLVEAMTYSCVNKTRARLDRDSYGECRYNSKRHQGDLCPACKIFGAMGYQGQVVFSDAPLVNGQSIVHFIPPQFQPKGDRDRRIYPHDLIDDRDPTWPLEAADIDSQFSLQVTFENLSAAELGLVLLALGQGPQPICLKIGAGKSAGMGTVQFTELRADVLDMARLYNTYASQPAWQAVDTAHCLAEAGMLLRDDDALDTLRSDLGCDAV